MTQKIVPFEKDIVLVGMMGVGKTTVAKIISAELGYQFVDTDQLIEAKYKKSIRELFKEIGEDQFREYEKLVLNEIAYSPDSFCRIVSTGGGIVCDAENRQILKQSPHVFWLKKNLDTILSSISDHALILNRPMLKRMDLRRSWEELALEREALYREVILPDHEVECDRLDPWQVYLAIAKTLGI